MIANDLKSIADMANDVDAKPTGSSSYLWASALSLLALSAVVAVVVVRNQRKH